MKDETEHGDFVRELQSAFIPFPSAFILNLVGDGGTAPLVGFRPSFRTAVLQTAGRIITRVNWWRQWELHPSQTDCETVSPLRHMCPRELARWVGAAPTRLGFGDPTAHAGAHRIRKWCARRESHPHLRVGNAVFCY
jgi:hypothetical protein